MNQSLMWTMSTDKPPVTKKIGARRVRTEPVGGQRDEPTDKGEPGRPDSANDSRLKADKPPHY
jgi:hypothetical protein